VSSAPKWSEVTAIFGGTFDPPHLGHREAALGLLRHPGVKQVRVLPSWLPPHKSRSGTPAGHRVGMVERCFEGASGVRIDLREIERGEARPDAPTYSYDTLSELGREIPARRLAFVIGADQLAQLPTWHRFPEVLGLSHWIVLARRPQGESLAYSALKDLGSSGKLGREIGPNCWQLAGTSHTCLQLVSTEARELSSTGIREAIARTGKPPEGALPEAVSAYLKLHRLYGSQSA
jgi:nicotinate-nucleotide adenylyltransferase